MNGFHAELIKDKRTALLKQANKTPIEKTLYFGVFLQVPESFVFLVTWDFSCLLLPFYYVICALVLSQKEPYLVPFRSQNISIRELPPSLTNNTPGKKTHVLKIISNHNRFIFDNVLNLY